MSSENEDHVLLKSPDESKPEPQKKSKLSYARDFLLSLSELDVCKKLPNGFDFDVSILREYGGYSSTTFERQRNIGSLPLQSSKHGEYVSILQNRSESAFSYTTRGNLGRWDTRSSGSSDKDGDLQSDRESTLQDSGRRFGNQTRHSWQNSEHDGLLGSGAFSRPTGFTGTSAPKGRGNEHYQLNRSTEPYQPPRPYKAMPYSRKDGTDSYNDETFGSIECSSEDRAEEERKRRASFELMRKEQQKALEEKHKQNPDNHKEHLDSDIMQLLGNSADGNSMSRSKSDETVVASLSHSDSSRHVQAPASRPLVPPGFRSALVDKNLPVQSSNTSPTPKYGSAVVEHKHSLSRMQNNQDKRNIPTASLHANVEKSAPKVSSQLSTDENKNLMVPILSGQTLKKTVDFEKMSGEATVQDANEVWEDEIVIMNDSSCKKIPASEIVNSVNQDQSTMILEKLFSSDLSKNYASSPKSIEHQGVKADEGKRNPAVFESSKFARWFSEEERKSEEVFSSRDLLSLIVSKEKSGSQVPTSNEKASEHNPLNLAFESGVTAPKLSPATSSVVGFSEQYSHDDKKGPSSVVLMCEDLEQSILAEVNDNSPSLHCSTQGGWTSLDGNSEKQKTGVDDHASQHLLSLLQKGTSFKEPMPSYRPDIIESTDRFSSSHVNPSFGHISDNAVGRNPEMVQNSEQTLTLEALFGASFMNALHSAEAPVSAQRGSDGTVNNTDVMQPHGVPFPRVDEGFLFATSHESRSNKTIHEGEVLAWNNTQKDHTIPGPRVVDYIDSSIYASKRGDSGILEGGPGGIQLPEEDSLITVGDTVNSMTIDPFTLENAHKPEEFGPENKNPEDLNNKFLNAIFKDSERLRTHVSDGPTQLQKGQVEMVDHNDLYHHLHARPSSQFPHQMDQTRPLFPPLDHLAHRNPHMKFTGPNGMHDPHHPFSGNLIPRHAFNNMGAPRFDPGAAHHPLLPHMRVPGNSPPHHQMQSLPRHIPSSHPVNHMPGFMPEVNNMHNFPRHYRQPNYGGGLGMGLPGPAPGGGGVTHSEALERLVEMEMRAKSKKIHPPAGVQIPGIYAPENMNFRYM